MKPKYKKRAKRRRMLGLEVIRGVEMDGTLVLAETRKGMVARCLYCGKWFFPDDLVSDFYCSEECERKDQERIDEMVEEMFGSREK